MIAVLLMGALVGLANGFLVTRIKIDSFIATLGTGTVLYGLNAWYTGGQQVLADLPRPFLDISGSLGPLPAPALYTLVISFGLWIVFEYLPLGRYLYVLGASPRAAELNGISAKRYVTLGFVAAGTLASFAGIVLQSQLQIGQSSVGQEYLLPAFTAALLGATSIRPGRVNVWGTVLAVAVLAVTVAGLNQLGAPFFVEPLFNGSMLVLAVGLAVQASQRRTRRGSEADRAAAALAQSRASRGNPLMDGDAPRSCQRMPATVLRWGPIGISPAGAPRISAATAICMTPAKVLEATAPDQDRARSSASGGPMNRQMPIAPGRAYALRMPGGPTGGPYGEVEPNDLERRVHQPPRSARSGRRWMPSAISAANAGRRATRPRCSSTTATGWPTCGRPMA